MKCWEITPLDESIMHPKEMEITQWEKSGIAENKAKMLKPNVKASVCV